MEFDLDDYEVKLAEFEYVVQTPGLADAIDAITGGAVQLVQEVRRLQGELGKFHECDFISTLGGVECAHPGCDGELYHKEVPE